MSQPKVNNLFNNRPRLYDSKPFSKNVMDCINANFSLLQSECRKIIVPGVDISFDDVFCDTIIRCANDLSLDAEPESTIIDKFLYLFGTTNTCYWLTKRGESRFVEFKE